MNHLALFFSTFFYSGLLLGKKGKGSGTVTSIFVTVILLSLYNAHLTSTFIIVAAVTSFIVGISAIKRAEAFLVSKWGAVKRHTGEIVTRDLNQTTIDEVYGMLIAVTPIYYSVFHDFVFSEFLIAHLVALAAFRVFDTWKPWPIRWIEKELSMSSSIIMIDDGLAGVMAFFVTLITLHLFLG